MLPACFCATCHRIGGLAPNDKPLRAVLHLRSRNNLMRFAHGQTVKLTRCSSLASKRASILRGDDVEKWVVRVLFGAGFPLVTRQVKVVPMNCGYCLAFSVFGVLAQPLLVAVKVCSSYRD